MGSPRQPHCVPTMERKINALECNGGSSFRADNCRGSSFCSARVNDRHKLSVHQCSIQLTTTRFGIVTALLAVLAVSAAGGMRIALPLLLIGLLRGPRLWSEVPILSAIAPPIAIGVLTSWALFELFASKRLLGQRILQLIQLIFSPIAGAMMGIALAQATGISEQLTGLLGVVSGLLALVLQLVQTGWFYRLRGLPMWAIALQDLLCVALVIFAFDAPAQGGLIALMLLWLAIRSSRDWYLWYTQTPAKRRHSLN